jgi:uncharacterized phiE125 gp8 family phage protein
VNIGDIYAGLVPVTPPASEPMTLLEAEQHLRVDPGDSGGPIDTYVNILITAARQFCETTLRRAIFPQSWMLLLKNWPGRDYQNWPLSLTSELDLYYKYNYIKLPLPPLQSVQSVNFRQNDGTILSMSPANFQVIAGFTYNVETNMEPGRIVLPYAQIWPTNILMPGAPIMITYTCGYVPLAQQSSPPVGQTWEQWAGYRATMQAMKLLLAYWYEMRLPPVELRKSRDQPAGEELVANALLTPYRIYD